MVVWTGSRLADSCDIPVSAGFQLRNVVNMGLAVNATDSLLMLVPAVLVRLLRLPSVESLDGFVIGAFGALAYTTGGVTWLATQFTAGLRTITIRVGCCRRRARSTASSIR